MFELDELLSEMERNSAFVTGSFNATLNQIYQETAVRYPNLTMLSLAVVSVAVAIRQQFKKRPEPLKIALGESATNSPDQLAELKAKLEELEASQVVLNGQFAQASSILIRALELHKASQESQKSIAELIVDIKNQMPTSEDLEKLGDQLNSLTLVVNEQAQANNDIADLRRLDTLKRAGLEQRRNSERKLRR